MAHQWAASKRDPWIIRICACCRTFYSVIYPARFALLVTSILLCVAGSLMLISTILVCGLTFCLASVKWSLIAPAIICILTACCVLYCVWASHSLDRAWFSAGTVGEHKKGHSKAADVDASKTESSAFWQFVDDEPWQNQCSLKVLQ